MKLKMMLLAIVAVLVTSFSAQAQVKIGYTNLEVVLASMPEAKTMERELQVFEENLVENQSERRLCKQKYQEYLDKKERGAFLTPAEQEAAEKELLRLDEEVQKLAQDAEYDMMAKRQALLEPVLAKLQTAIDAVAIAGGYTYILNQTTSAGVSTILYGPDEADITKALFGKLGLKYPEQ
ncbi:MAG: OmpH family outer membrane protein [Bacteroidetes bacterium]|nr:OmpH family outer membrane protein [Bacteroidota bacterium]